MKNKITGYITNYTEEGYGRFKTKYPVKCSFNIVSMDHKKLHSIFKQEQIYNGNQWVKGMA